MGLNKSKGNMYEWITHTWNTIKGECEHNCSYCYVKRWGKQNPVRFDEKELKTDLGKGNFIFVGSGCDMFSENIPEEWIKETINHCNKYPDNTYLFQTKNPIRFYQEAMDYYFPPKHALCVTIETNRFYKEHMGNTPKPKDRSWITNDISHDIKCKTFVTIEPIMDFDLKELDRLIETCLPEQVNIGADSGRNGLPEPSKEKIIELISEMEKYTVVKQKKNLNRLLK